MTFFKNDDDNEFNTVQDIFNKYQNEVIDVENLKMIRRPGLVL